MRGINEGGRVQQYIDTTVIQRCDPKVPMLTGTLKNSAAAHTVIGSGEVQYVTPYARRQYNTNKGNGERGALWFERMKKEDKDMILEGAKRVSSG